MVLEFARIKRNFPPLLIDNIEIERVKSARIIGVTIHGLK